MNMTPLGQMKYRFEIAHQEVCALVGGLSDEKIAWQAHPAATSIAFNVWHLARWADYVQSHLRTNTPGLRARLTPHAEIWGAEQLAVAWGLIPAALGREEAGNGLEERAAELRFPGRAVLLDYLQRCYALEEEALAAVDEEQFEAHSDEHPTTPEDTVGAWLMHHLIHEWEHLGIIRSLSGLYDLNAG